MRYKTQTMRERIEEEMVDMLDSVREAFGSSYLQLYAREGISLDDTIYDSVKKVIEKVSIQDREENMVFTFGYILGMEATDFRLSMYRPDVLERKRKEIPSQAKEYRHMISDLITDLGIDPGVRPKLYDLVDKWIGYQENIIKLRKSNTPGIF